ncbi:hypothetical protein [Nonomuraea angiospora]|nr:hypothetical protein [Nonomuraea angiospora]MDX3106995.1 hypothetical protein [Nonomuraea angiospora]
MARTFAEPAEPAKIAGFDALEPGGPHVAEPPGEWASRPLRRRRR